MHLKSCTSVETFTLTDNWKSGMKVQGSLKKLSLLQKPVQNLQNPMSPLLVNEFFNIAMTLYQVLKIKTKKSNAVQEFGDYESINSYDMSVKFRLK